MTASGQRRFSASVILVVVLSLLFSLPAGAQPPAPRPVHIREMTIEGNRRIQEAVILGAVRSKIGTVFNPSALSEDLRSIFALGFFDDVQMRVEDFEGGVRVVFVVVERPFIRDIDFAGNQKIDTSVLSEKIELRLGSVYNPVEVQRARERLREHYEEEGYYEVEITPQVDKFPDGDVRVTFAINEGRKITIDKILIHGNRGLRDSAIKAVLATQERQYYILRGTVQRQRLDEDVERIIALYNDHGFIQARVEGPPRIEIDHRRARVTIHIDVVEGPQYHVGDVRATGVTLVPEGEVTRQIQLKTGDVFSRSKVRDSVRMIGDLYSTIGRASAEVVPKTDQHAPPVSRIDITFEIAEGPEVYVERININGNARSQDKILRREIPMAEGDPFTLQKLQRARQKLINLGYFETVNVSTVPGSDRTKIIVNVDVTERPTGLFSIGAGFSSVDAFVGTLDLSQRNFLGRGWEASLRLRAGDRTQQGSVSFTEPWLFDRPLSAGFDLFNLRRQYVEYDLDSLGGNVRLSHPFAEYARWHTGYRLTRDKISDLAEVGTSELAEEEGSRVTSLVSGALTRDSRDNVLNPTKGGQASIALEFAGLGGDTRFVKTIGLVTYFRPIWFGHVLSGRIEGGYAFGWSDDPLPLFERFYLGGPNSVRSFKFRGISPRDASGTRIGGNIEMLGTIEYIVPLPFGLRLAAFFDVGNVYGPDIKIGTSFDPMDTREAVGGGVRWNSPFGPIRIDYGINLDRRRDEDFGAFHFSVGSPF